jgi:polyhydroxybutyrate depolymerase
MRVVQITLSLAAAALLVAAGCSGGNGGGSGGAAGTTTSAPRGGEDAAPVPSAGCDGAATAEAQVAEEMLTDATGTARRWLVSAPAWEPGADPLPLVLDFHGLSEGADIHARMSGMGAVGVQEGFMTVFPHGTGVPVRWDLGTDPAAGDLAYVGKVLDQVEAERCVDMSRVYATGLSNGAMMTSVVGCALSDRVAAIAPVSGIILPDDCHPDHPMPVLAFHGTADPILLFNGGVGPGLQALFGGGPPPGSPTTTLPPADIDGAGYPETVRGWATLDGCDHRSTDEQVSDEVIKRTFDCPDDAPVEFVIVEGGGHSWPGSEFSKTLESIVGPTTFDIDASQEIWRFFQRFSLSQAS